MKRSFSVFATVVVSAGLIGGCHYEPSDDLVRSYHEREVEEWRETRVARLTGSLEYLRLVGLYWLEPGSVTIGSDPQSGINLPIDQGRIGVLTVESKRTESADPVVWFTPSEGSPVMQETKKVTDRIAMRSDNMDDTTVLRIGDVSFYLIERNTRLGVRVLDENAPTLANFHGIDHYPISTKWLVNGRYQAFETPTVMEVADVSGGTQLIGSPGRVTFEVDGQKHSLDLIGDADSDDYWIIFGDETNGQGSYGAGRYLYTNGRENEKGELEIDFNYAYNPPCAFNPYATCPLPPKQNKLTAAVEAGEKDYHL